MNKAKKFVVPFLLLLLLSGPALVFSGSSLEMAQANNPFDLGSQEGFKDGEIPDEGFGQGDSPRDIRSVVAGLIQAVLGLLAIIFLILIIWSGFEWMTAGGNEEKISQAKKRLKNSFIGLVIILAAYGITYFVIEHVYDASRESWEW